MTWLVCIAHAQLLFSSLLAPPISGCGNSSSRATITLDMPGKKKKGGKAKGGKDGGEGGLPPPPQLDEQRQGALEALLKYK